MTRGLSIAITLGLLAGAARAEDRAAPARELVREALAARALGPVAPPVLPVLVPGSQGEPRPGRETPPGTPPSPGSHPKPAGTPRPAAPGTTAPPAGHPMTHTTRSEAVGPGAQDAHRIRADAANRAAVGRRPMAPPHRPPTPGRTATMPPGTCARWAWTPSTPMRRTMAA